MRSRDLLLDTMRSTVHVISTMHGQPQLFDAFEHAVALCVRALTDSRKIMLCGNGGSAADAQHIAAELVGRFSKARPGLGAISLATDVSALTAIGNDFGFDKIFSRQVEAIGNNGDVLIAISTSGGSKNVIDAVRAAKAANINVIGLTAGGGGKLAELHCDALLCVPSSHTPRIQEAHIVIGHALCQAIEYALFENITE